MPVSGKRAKSKETRRLEKDLLAKRDQLGKQIEQQRAGILMERDTDDEGAAAVSSVEKELAANNLARAMRSLTEVEIALKSIESGDYGICTRCGEQISEARLNALPWARVCVECAGGGVKNDLDPDRVHPQVAASALQSSGTRPRVK
jgi:DnaK suppressor protein